MTNKKTKLPEGFILYIPYVGKKISKAFVVRRALWLNTLVVPLSVDTIGFHYNKKHNRLAISYGGEIKVGKTAKGENRKAIYIGQMIEQFGLKIGSRWCYSKTEGKLDIYEEEN